METLWDTIRRTADLVGSERRLRWALLVGFALVVTALEAAGAYLVYVMLRLIASPDEVVSLPLVGPLTDASGASTTATRVGVALAVALFFVVRGAVVVVREYVQHRVVGNEGAALAGRLLRGYLAMPYLFHVQRNSAELVRNTYSATGEFVKHVLTPLADLLAQAVFVAGMVAVLAVTAPAATLIAAAVMLPTVLALQAFVQPRLRGFGRRAQDAAAGSIAAIQQSLEGIRDLKVLGREDAFADVHLRHRMRLSRSWYAAAALKELPQALVEVALVVTIVVIYVVANAAGTPSDELLATLGLFAYVGLRLLPSLQHLVSAANEVRYSAAAVDDLAADRAEIDRWLARSHGGDGAATPRTGAGHRGIELVGVGFRYPGAEGPALRDVDLTIRRGEFVGICGPTGGGKSTLVDLIVGLLHPTEGRVLVDGRELEEDPAWWYAQLGVVSQQVFLVDDTLRRNIALGVPDDAVDLDRLAGCVERAQLAAVVAGLPDGLDTVVGERGIRLSGGQRQRVAVARALYREPPVLVFDEGTSALDAATEGALVAAVAGLRGSRTLIAVAHRITSVRDADRLVVVDGGRVVADGPYDELLAGSALFRELAT